MITPIYVEKWNIPFPCRIGDILWDISEFLNNTPSPEIYKISANYITVYKDDKGEIIYTIDGRDYKFEDFGKIVFRSEAEALEALAENAPKGYEQYLEERRDY